MTARLILGSFAAAFIAFASVEHIEHRQGCVIGVVGQWAVCIGYQ